MSFRSVLGQRAQYVDQTLLHRVLEIEVTMSQYAAAYPAHDRRDRLE